MMFPRPGSLRMLLVCLFVGLPLAAQQPPAQQQQPPTTPPAKPTPPQQKKANPFETIPQTEPPPSQPPVTAPPKLEAPKPAQQEVYAPPADDNIEAVEFRGTRRVPPDTLRALVQTVKG